MTEELHPEVRLFRAVEQARRVFREDHVPLSIAASEAAVEYGVEADEVLQLATTAEDSLAEWRESQKKFDRSLQSEQQH